MTAFMLIINIVIILVAIVLIISVLMQQGNRAGLGAIGGGAETFFGKSKAKSYEGKLQLITKISAAVFTVLVIVLAATYNRTGTTTTAPVVEPTATAAPAEGEEAVPADEAGEAADEAGEAVPADEADEAEAAATEAPAAEAVATAEATPAAPPATEAPEASPAA